MPKHRLGRSWGTRYDSLTSSESLASNPESVVATSHHVSSSPRSVSADEGNSAHDARDGILQDASIFIGSLPSHIEHLELTNMLSQHLSEHPQVKNIKVVRDSKGGTCAFIQCQDSEAASTLLNDLHVAPPQPFLGRYLRYEPARAFRTLLISYRSPRQYIRHRNASRKAGFPSSEDPRFIELQLPNSMRIIRTPGTKQFTILYNDQALDIPPVGGAESGLLLVPLLYDAESLFRIASVFGAVEYFGPHRTVNGQVVAQFPDPHNGPRSPVMDPGCWKVKWAHRDDCVSALVALRRVPHLTVTWAHQSNTTFREQGGLYNPRAFPGIRASSSWRTRAAGPAFRSASGFLPESCTYPALGTTAVVERPTGAKVADPSSGCDVWQQETFIVPHNRNPHPSRITRPRALSLTHDRPPPAVSLPSRESTGQLSFTNWESTNRTRWADHVESVEFKGSPSVAGPNFTSSPYLGHRNPSLDSSYHTSPQESDSQEIDAGIPHTPNFGTSPVTPRTPGSFMLRTPTTASYMGDFRSMSFSDFDSRGSLTQLSQEKRDDHIVDPTTIFVGGLEMFGPNAWDESKVRALFSKYGGIEAVKVIRPSNKRSAFAFVKFNNIESPARAVKAEHNRMLDGRLIRVQLRDWNPAYRPFWRPEPNKGTASQPLGASDAFGVNPSLPKPPIVDIGAHRADPGLSDSPNQPAPPSFGDVRELNEVKETGISPVVPPADNPDHDSVRRTEISTDNKQVESSVADTTLVSSDASMVPATALPGMFAGPAIQYYHGWIPNYAPQFPYQVPFAGQPYPGYSFPPPIVPPVPQSGGSDGGIPLPIGPINGAYPAFMPYPPLVGPNPDSGQTAVGHQGVANNPTLIHAQAPLIPTGFIQGDQGMLVPVYPPDALNQYMTGNQNQSQPSTNSGTAEGQSPVAWHPCPPPPVRPQAVVFHSYINPPLTAPPPHFGAHAWVSGHAWQGLTPQTGIPHGSRRIASAPGGPTPTSMGSGFERNIAPPRRQYRRENHSQHHKNIFSRAAGRFNKAPFDAPRSPSDTQSVSAPQAVLETSPDANWQPWDTDQGNIG